MASSQEGKEAKLESQTEKFDLRRNAFILEHLLEEAELRWEQIKIQLEDLRTLRGNEKNPEYLVSKIELTQDKANVECLLEQMKSVKDEGNLEPQRWKMRLSDNMEKAEFILQEMKSNARLAAPELELQLNEQIAKSELLLKEIELVGVAEKVAFEEGHIFVVVKSPVLKMQLENHIVKVESLLENIKSAYEDSKEDTVKLKFLLYEIKFALEICTGKGKSSFLRSMLEAYVVKLKLLLDETELEKEKQEIGSQMLGKELLLEELIKDGFSLMIPSSWVLHSERRNLARILSILREMKSEHKGEGLKPQVLEVKLKQKEKEEHATTSKSPQEKMKLVEESKIESPTLEMQLKECIVELDGLLKEGKLKFLNEELEFRKFKRQLHRGVTWSPDERK